MPGHNEVVTDPSTVLRVADLGVTVQTAALLTNVNLTLTAGSITGIAGESGSGKSTLAACIAGDVSATTGRIEIFRRPDASPAIRPRGRHVPHGSARVGIVWQTIEQCGNIDVASNLLLGTESARLARSDYRLRVSAERLVADLGIDIPDVSRPMSSLSRSEQQLVAIARALGHDPDLIVLDDPTFSLGVRETAAVERLLGVAKHRGAAVLLISSDLHQLLRRSDRIVVLRRGRVVATVDPAVTHADDLGAMIAGDEVATSARRQLLRIQGLAEELATTGPKSGLPLITTVLGTALGAQLLCLHVARGDTAWLASSSGLTAAQLAALRSVSLRGDPEARTGEAAAPTPPDPTLPAPVLPAPTLPALAPIARAITESRICRDVPDAWLTGLGIEGRCAIVPITGSGGVLGAITVFLPPHQQFTADELDLVGLYAGYAATTIEHERLVGEITVRNGVLETIRGVLEVLSGPGTFEDTLSRALGVLQVGTGAACVVVAAPRPDGLRTQYAVEGAAGVVTLGSELLGRGGDTDTLEVGDGAAPPDVVLAACTVATRLAVQRGAIEKTTHDDRYDVATFATPAGRGVLLAWWPPDGGTDRGDLLADAAHFLSLAFERQDADLARQQAAALRRAEQLQRQFLARLSHELRTPLTAIRGYASSLTQPDVTWDADSERTFLTRISDESDRLGRLVGDLLDFSAMESGVLRLNLDWCTLPLVLDAARACLPTSAAERVTIHSAPNVPAVWADHDRLEQVFVNLIGNAIRHNPPTTSVAVDISARGGGVTITVSDDGIGLPVGSDLGDGDAILPMRSATSGSGLGLSIVRGIIEAHGGTVAAEPVPRGTRWRVVLPEESPEPAPTRSAVRRGDAGDEDADGTEGSNTEGSDHG